MDPIRIHGLRFVAHSVVRVTAVTLFLELIAPLAIGGDRVDFGKQIRPIFKERCYACHGPEKQDSGLRLDRRQEALAGGDSGAAIVPGDVTTGHLLSRVQSEDGEQVMPPKGDRLTKQQIKLLKQWIEDGAKWPEDAESDGRQR